MRSGAIGRTKEVPMFSDSVSVSREIGGRTLTIETGKIAKQAGGAVIISYGESSVICAVVRANPREGLDFFPLTVDYRERASAAGKFPGGFRKREGAPSEREVLIMRMIDRPIRPLFPDGFVDEVLIQALTLGHDQENDTDILACIGSSACLAISDIPFEGPIATVRVGRLHTEQGPQYVINPTVTQMEYSDLDLVVAGHKDGMNMIELGAAEVDEAGVMGAIEFSNGFLQTIIGMIDELVSKVGKPKVMPKTLYLPSDEVTAKVAAACEKDLAAARKIPGKKERNNTINEIQSKMLDAHFQINTTGNVEAWQQSVKNRTMAKEAFKRLDEKMTRKQVLDTGNRTDGRGLTQIRPLLSQVGFIARTHGSALFQRGETQAIVTCTLGTGKDEQIIDGLLPEYSKKFTHHYNFPPYSVGEVKRVTGPGRREIGHGALAERSLLGILPSAEEFPYTIRLVSEITESNGSTSQASVCGGCLALMDAGVPIKATCAGISVGRFSDETGRELYVTDIIGEEDFYGDMDFKVAGTRDGITGIQLDMKIRGLTIAQIKRTIDQAREGRLFIIDHMEQTIAQPRAEISAHAPRIATLKIDPEKIGKLIGPGGKMIRGLQDRYNVTIDVQDDGTVNVASADRESLMAARSEIEALCEEIKVGTIYTGKVVSTKDFGAFVELAPGTDGMCHISELADGYVKSVLDVVRVGDMIKVKVILVDEQGRIKLSRKAVIADEKAKSGAVAPAAAPSNA